MIILPDGLQTANELLKAFSIVSRSQWKGSCLQILLLNLMPEKQITEADIVRMLDSCNENIEIIPMRIDGQQYKTTSQAYVETYYTVFEALQSGEYDGLIVTGAPIEHLSFEEVRYWKELCTIMDWAKNHVRSSLYICWGAQAALYHQWQIPKYGLSEKMFGVFPYECLQEVALLHRISSPFNMPTSRHTEVRSIDFPIHNELQMVAESQEAGVGIAISHKGREVYVTGHLEYAALRLNDEYQRDLSKGKAIKTPRYYYSEMGIPLFQWRNTALQVYQNWVKYYVCQSSNNFT